MILRLKEIGPSELVPFIKGESYQDRHDRRFKKAIEELEKLERWVKDKNYKFKWDGEKCSIRCNRGKRMKFYAIWIPRFARLSLNKGVKKFEAKAYDVSQVIIYLGELLK